MWLPLYTLVNSLIGYILCIVLFMAIYYRNQWESLNFPFLSQLLFDPSSNSTSFVPYDLKAILTPDNELNLDAVDKAGIPYMSGTYVGYLITTNMGITAALVHMLLWNYDVRGIQPILQGLGLNLLTWRRISKEAGRFSPPIT